MPRKQKNPPPQIPPAKGLLAKNARKHWTLEEDKIITSLRQDGKKWENISKALPGRTALACRLHYQNYLEQGTTCDEKQKNELSRLYEKFREDMWSTIAVEMGIPWKAVEAMHWQLGEVGMAKGDSNEGFSSGSSAPPVPVNPSLKGENVSK